MKNIFKKRLNNKGFTLIELLAVIVILAVVMGIATTSVLSAMNKARGGALSDSAAVVADVFAQKYAEALVGGVASNIFYDDYNVSGYNFQSSVIYKLTANLADVFNISTSDYKLVDSTTVSSVSAASSLDTSFVVFNTTTGKFTVCLFAEEEGSVFVDNYKVSSATDIATYNGYKIKGASGTMFACSDGLKSW